MDQRQHQDAFHLEIYSLGKYILELSQTSKYSFSLTLLNVFLLAVVVLYFFFFRHKIEHSSHIVTGEQMKLNTR